MFTVESARPGDEKEIAQLYAEIFFDDPVWSAIVPQDSKRKRVIEAAFRKELAGGGVAHVDVARDREGRIVGAMNYQTPDGSSHQLTPLQRGLERVGALLVPWVRRSARHEEVMSGFHPSVPHWYLRDLVTAASARGQGLGSRLLQRRLDIADAEGVPVFLESTTPASRRLYERHGFKLVGTVSELPGTNSYAMVRPVSEKTD